MPTDEPAWPHLGWPQHTAVAQRRAAHHIRPCDGSLLPLTGTTCIIWPKHGSQLCSLCLSLPLKGPVLNACQPPYWCLCSFISYGAASGRHQPSSNLPITPWGQHVPRSDGAVRHTNLQSDREPSVPFIQSTTARPLRQRNCCRHQFAAQHHPRRSWTHLQCSPQQPQPEWHFPCCC